MSKYVNLSSGWPAKWRPREESQESPIHWHSVTALPSSFTSSGEITKARRSRFWGAVKTWAPFTLSSLLALGAAIFPGPEIAMSCASGGIALSFVDKVVDYEPRTPERKLYRQLASLKGGAIK